MSLNPVAQLAMLCQKHKIPTPVYGEADRQGKDHCPSFIFYVEVAGRTFAGRERKNTKKGAKNEAAAVALEEWEGLMAAAGADVGAMGTDNLIIHLGDSDLVADAAGGAAEAAEDLEDGECGLQETHEEQENGNGKLDGAMASIADLLVNLNEFTAAGACETVDMLDVVMETRTFQKPSNSRKRPAIDLNGANEKKKKALKIIDIDEAEPLPSNHLAAVLPVDKMQVEKTSHIDQGTLEKQASAILAVVTPTSAMRSVTMEVLSRVSMILGASDKLHFDHLVMAGALGRGTALTYSYDIEVYMFSSDRIVEETVAIAKAVIDEEVGKNAVVFAMPGTQDTLCVTMFGVQLVNGIGAGMIETENHVSPDDFKGGFEFFKTNAQAIRTSRLLKYWASTIFLIGDTRLHDLVFEVLGIYGYQTKGMALTDCFAAKIRKRIAVEGFTWSTDVQDGGLQEHTKHTLPTYQCDEAAAIPDHSSTNLKAQQIGNAFVRVLFSQFSKVAASLEREKDHGIVKKMVRTCVKETAAVVFGDGVPECGDGEGKLTFRLVVPILSTFVVSCKFDLLLTQASPLMLAADDLSPAKHRPPLCLPLLDGTEPAFWDLSPVPVDGHAASTLRYRLPSRLVHELLLSLHPNDLASAITTHTGPDTTDTTAPPSLNLLQQPILTDIEFARAHLLRWATPPYSANPSQHYPFTEIDFSRLPSAYTLAAVLHFHGLTRQLVAALLPDHYSRDPGPRRADDWFANIMATAVQMGMVEPKTGGLGEGWNEGEGAPSVEPWFPFVMAGELDSVEFARALLEALHAGFDRQRDRTDSWGGRRDSGIDDVDWKASGSDTASLSDRQSTNDTAAPHIRETNDHIHSLNTLLLASVRRSAPHHRLLRHLLLWSPHLAWTSIDLSFPAIAEAATHGQPEAMRLLLRRGANPLPDADDDWTLLHHAALRNHVGAVRVVLDEIGADVDDRSNEEGCTALHLAAGSGCVESVELLLARGAAVDMTTLAGGTALHEAAVQGWWGVVEILLASGAEKGKVDGSGQTALELVMERLDEVERGQGNVGWVEPGDLRRVMELLVAEGSEEKHVRRCGEG
ncbi:Transient receptor putative cation channel sub A member 1 [Phlyctochytrium bullatum]|nr:Transient receptor putative cation channel sub A member 1 [Phlyctochytrium bullatum]